MRATRVRVIALSVAAGLAMAVGLLTMLYGVVLAMLLCACAAIVARRQPQAEPLDQIARHAVPTAAVVAATGTVASLLAFAIMLLALTP